DRPPPCRPGQDDGPQRAPPPPSRDPAPSRGSGRAPAACLSMSPSIRGFGRGSGRGSGREPNPQCKAARPWLQLAAVLWVEQPPGGGPMQVAQAIVEILKREGVEFVIGYPVNPVLEAAAAADMRPIIVRQERTGIHMADAYSRMNSGAKVGVFAMQHGPGTENAFGGVAQAYSESVPLVVLPGGYQRALMQGKPNFPAYLNYQHVTKSIETLMTAAHTSDTLRRAFAQARNSRMGPTMVEIPGDVAR